MRIRTETGVNGILVSTYAENERISQTPLFPIFFSLLMTRLWHKSQSSTLSAYATNSYGGKVQIDVTYD